MQTQTIVALAFIGIFLIAGFVVYNNIPQEIEGPQQYQGPVPQGYDLQHFRETGETIVEVNK